MVAHQRTTIDTPAHNCLPGARAPTPRTVMSQQKFHSIQVRYLRDRRCGTRLCWARVVMSAGEPSAARCLHQSRAQSRGQPAWAASRSQTQAGCLDAGGPKADGPTLRRLPRNTCVSCLRARWQLTSWHPGSAGSWPPGSAASAGCSLSPGSPSGREKNAEGGCAVWGATMGTRPSSMRHQQAEPPSPCWPLAPAR